MNIMEHVFLLYVRASFGYIPRSSIAGSSSKTISNFLRKHHTDFQTGCTNLQSHKQQLSVLLSLHLCQHLLPSEFFFNLQPLFPIFYSVTYNELRSAHCSSLCIWVGFYPLRWFKFHTYKLYYIASNHLQSHNWLSQDSFTLRLHVGGSCRDLHGEMVGRSSSEMSR